LSVTRDERAGLRPASGRSDWLAYCAGHASSHAPIAHDDDPSLGWHAVVASKHPSHIQAIPEVAALFLQVPLLGQTLPQRPQLAASSREMQEPPQHSLPLVVEHTMPQPPQWFASLTERQTPSQQLAADPQSFPQLPQCFGSFLE